MEPVKEVRGEGGTNGMNWPQVGGKRKSCSGKTGKKKKVLKGGANQAKGGKPQNRKAVAGTKGYGNTTRKERAEMGILHLLHLKKGGEK